MLDPEIEARPWADQLVLDDAIYRAQLAYLFDRSAFYRDKLGIAGFATVAARRSGQLGHQLCSQLRSIVRHRRSAHRLNL